MDLDSGGRVDPRPPRLPRRRDGNYLGGKAFDTVPHARLILEVSQFSTEPHILPWLPHFLSDLVKSVAGR